MKKALLFTLLGVLTVIFNFNKISDDIAYKKVSDNYQMIESDYISDKKWHLYIGRHEDNERYFTIYDNGGIIRGEEHPWIIGSVEKVDGDRMIINVVDEELFNSVESDWKLENGKLILDYKKTEETMILTNQNSNITFEVQEFITNWKK